MIENVKNTILDADEITYSCETCPVCNKTNYVIIRGGDIIFKQSTVCQHLRIACIKEKGIIQVTLSFLIPNSNIYSKPTCFGICLNEIASIELSNKKGGGRDNA